MRPINQVPEVTAMTLQTIGQAVRAQKAQPRLCRIDVSTGQTLGWSRAGLVTPVWHQGASLMCAKLESRAEAGLFVGITPVASWETALGEIVVSVEGGVPSLRCAVPRLLDEYSVPSRYSVIDGELFHPVSREDRESPVAWERRLEEFCRQVIVLVSAFCDLVGWLETNRTAFLDQREIGLHHAASVADREAERRAQGNG